LGRSPLIPKSQEYSNLPEEATGFERPGVELKMLAFGGKMADFGQKVAVFWRFSGISGVRNSFVSVWVTAKPFGFNGEGEGGGG